MQHHIEPFLSFFLPQSLFLWCKKKKKNETVNKRTVEATPYKSDAVSRMSWCKDKRLDLHSLLTTREFMTNSWLGDKHCELHPEIREKNNFEINFNGSHGYKYLLSFSTTIPCQKSVWSMLFMFGGLPLTQLSLDKVKWKAFRLTSFPPLTDCLLCLRHCLNVAFFGIFYLHFFWSPSFHATTTHAASLLKN